MDVYYIIVDKKNIFVFVFDSLFVNVICLFCVLFWFVLYEEMNC